MVNATITSGHPAGIESTLTHNEVNASITEVESDVETTIGSRDAGL